MQSQAVCQDHRCSNDVQQFQPYTLNPASTPDTASKTSFVWPALRWLSSTGWPTADTLLAVRAGRKPIICECQGAHKSAPTSTDESRACDAAMSILGSGTLLIFFIPSTKFVANRPGCLEMRGWVKWHQIRTPVGASGNGGQCCSQPGDAPPHGLHCRQPLVCSCQLAPQRVHIAADDWNASTVRTISVRT